MPPELPLSLLLLTALVAAQTGPAVGAAEGVVVEDETGKPIAGASVYCVPCENFQPAKRPSAMSDSQGRFRLQGLPLFPEIVLSAYKESDGYPYDPIDFFRTSDRAFPNAKIKRGSTTSGVTIRLTRAAVLELNVSDSEGTRINVENWELGFTREDHREYGPYWVSPSQSMLVPAAPFRFTLEVMGHRPWSSEVLTPKSGEVVSLTVRLDRDLAVTRGPAASASGAVEGVVVDYETRKPIVDARVYCLPTEQLRVRPSTTSDSQGKFLLEGVTPSPEVFLIAFKERDGYADSFFAFFKISGREHPNVKVEPGKTTSGVLIQLTKGALLDLEITDQFGAPINADDLGLAFTRVDHPEYGLFRRGAGSPRYSTLVPPVPFRFTVEAKSYRPWSSGLLSPKSGEIIKLIVHLDRN
jgi:hypothetical protein